MNLPIIEYQFRFDFPEHSLFSVHDARVILLWYFEDKFRATKIRKASFIALAIIFSPDEQ